MNFVWKCADDWEAMIRCIHVCLIAREAIFQTEDVYPVIPLNCVLNFIMFIGFLIVGY